MKLELTYGIEAEVIITMQLFILGIMQHTRIQNAELLIINASGTYVYRSVLKN